MRKKDKHKEDLTPLFEEFFVNKQNEVLVKYLLSHSNLPSRRANLELAAAFVELVAAHIEKHTDLLYNFLLFLLEFSVDKAPVNNPKEFLPFCGTRTLGNFVTLDAYGNQALSNLKKMAIDSRWRIREAIAFGLQTMIKNNKEQAMRELQDWLLKNLMLV